MRIALVSDIHGNLPALEAVVSDIRRRGCDVIANLGDCLSGPLWPLETAQFLMAENWPAIAGNHERQILQLSAAQQGASDRFAAAALGRAEKAWLAALPPQLSLDNDVLLCHGTPHSDVHYLTEDIAEGKTVLAAEATIRTRLGGVRAGLIACGHSHIPRSLWLDGCTIVNPGSVGLQAYDDDHPPHTVENGSPHARYALAEHSAGGWRIGLYSVPYPHHLAAAKAAQENRPDWAYALQTGFMQAA
ncbi:putative phosphodiesterase [Neisseria sp. HSC-16F19]|nr:metallophosphoesterase family protein [Neisseria sp. HSC-16F19]MCP2039534.1 putative phosphodiesterase [Neisseria sp. HSC-16F19]